MLNKTFSRSKKDLLKVISNLIKSDIRKFEIEFDKALSSDVKLIKTIGRYLIKQRGKRIRPMLTLLSSHLCGGVPSKNTYKAAAMIELLHIATLIHDDVVDGAVKRRGWFSINRIWGNKLSVLMGDYVLSKSLIYMIKIRDFDILELISKTAQYMSSGEILQLDYRFKNHPTEEVYFDLIRQKTASLISAACELGGLTTTKSQKDCRSLRKFGMSLGMAFQIRDDLFDLYGNENLTGKDTGLDVKRNSFTLPIIHSLQTLSKKDRNLLLNIINQKNFSRNDISDLKELIEKGNGYNYANLKIEEFTQSAIDTILYFPDSDYKNSMVDLANYNQERVQ